MSDSQRVAGAWCLRPQIGSVRDADRVQRAQPGQPRLYELVEHAPKTGKSPTVWAWPELMDYLKIAGQPVAGPWPPHQEPRPDPDEDSLPVAVADPEPAEQRQQPEPGPLDERSAAATRA